MRGPEQAQPDNLTRMTSYPTPSFRRTALAPGLLGAVVLSAGIALLGTDGFIWIEYVVSILALVISVFAWQARQWWWIIGLVPVAVVWNPVYPFAFEGTVWLAAQFIAALLFVVTAVFIKVPNPDDRNVAQQT